MSQSGRDVGRWSGGQRSIGGDQHFNVLEAIETMVRVWGAELGKQEKMIVKKLAALVRLRFIVYVKILFNLILRKMEG